MNAHPTRKLFTWQLRSRALELGARTLVMGIVNVTPDSFSDGGHFASSDAAVAHALRLLDEGAELLDIGGESTRPGAKVGESGVSQTVELRRVMPVIEGVLKHRPEACISVDTYKSAVARAAVAEGAEIINDVSAGAFDPAMRVALAELRCGCVLMHMRGRPEEWRSMPRISGDELLALVKRELAEHARAAEVAGVQRERIVLDPGFGFGKNFEENYPLLARLGELAELGYPVLAGTSRKGFIGRALARNGEDAPLAERLFGTVATVVMAALAGAHIVRVHDVKAAVEALKLVDAVRTSAPAD
jgi:dihydropteroate synthase